MKVSMHNGVNKRIERFLEKEHELYESSQGVECLYEKFSVVATENGENIAALTGYTAFNEACVDDFIVRENYRKQGVGRSILELVEAHFKKMGFSDVNLVTNRFQAPGFYKNAAMS